MKVKRSSGGLRLLVVMMWFLFSALSSLSAQAGAGEKIFFHAKVFTGNPEGPYAEAVAIRGDKIVAVGNLPEVTKSLSENAERIDLGGKSLFPGFGRLIVTTGIALGEATRAGTSISLSEKLYTATLSAISRSSTAKP
jgi:hypothetical protein